VLLSQCFDLCNTYQRFQNTPSMGTLTGFRSTTYPRPRQLVAKLTNAEISMICTTRKMVVSGQ
jgi:hypothetical protein